MNEPQLDVKIQQDINRVKKDLNTLKEDGMNKVSEVGGDLGRSTEDVAAWVNSGVAQLSTDFGKVKDDATKTVVQASATVKKNVGSGLSQYNTKVAEVAKKLPGGFAAKAGMYPWVAITFALLTGFLLRGLFMPHRDTNENCNQPGCTQNMG